MNLMARHPQSALGRPTSYADRQRYAKITLIGFLLLIVTIALPPLGLVLLAISLTVQHSRRRARRSEAARRLPELERQAMLDRAAWLTRITDSPR